MTERTQRRFYLRPAVTEAEQHQRGILLANMRHQRSEIERMFIDCDHWNRAHPNDAPIDCDPDGILRQIADDLDAALLAEQGKPL